MIISLQIIVTRILQENCSMSVSKCTISSFLAEQSVSFDIYVSKLKTAADDSGAIFCCYSNFQMPCAAKNSAAMAACFYNM